MTTFAKFIKKAHGSKANTSGCGRKGIFGLRLNRRIALIPEPNKDNFKIDPDSLLRKRKQKLIVLNCTIPSCPTPSLKKTPQDPTSKRETQKGLTGLFQSA